MPNHDRFECQTAIDSDAILQKVAKVFVRNELIPLQDRIREINGWLGQEVIRFKNYSLDTDNG
ncbi:portal protein [Escherichia coli]|uniref:portal protein n=1 Tax=Escherichia coli TaxID=562 RepID=UPI000A3741A1|nr:portal protein [Escherichia coli]OUJ68377.1 portal protein [Escherichia coli]